MGYRRRFTRDEIRSLLEAADFRQVQITEFDRVAYLGWWLDGRMLRLESVPRWHRKIFDYMVWLWRRIDRFLPWPGLSLIVVATKKD